MKAAIFFLFLYCSVGFANPLKGIYLNNKASQSLKDKQVEMAQQNYLRALSEDSDNYIARINLGLSFILNEEIEKAKKEFEIPLQAGNSSDEVKYYAHFNKARAHHQAKETEPALLHYQQAVDLNNESLQAKANIELLVQQQSGQGKGGSGDEEDKDKKKEENEGNEKDQGGKQKDEEKKKPKKPQDLSEKDIEKILEELKNQEQKIRALEYGKKSKEEQSGKTW